MMFLLDLEQKKVSLVLTKILNHTLEIQKKLMVLTYDFLTVYVEFESFG